MLFDCDILSFPGVGVIIVEFVFRWLLIVSAPLDKAIAFGADSSAELLFGIRVISVVADSCLGIFENRDEAHSI